MPLNGRRFRTSPERIRKRPCQRRRTNTISWASQADSNSSSDAEAARTALSFQPSAVSPARSEFQEALAQDAGLQSADLQFLAVAENCDVRASRHDADLRDQIHVGQRAA